ncbi:hypothetical protein, partial [Streptomyces albogriseolus]|uniref:hypothetical protein n=1 Tax=Streptomyces albogriseolus TaxID=1887 RepID=UPI003460FADF
MVRKPPPHLPRQAIAAADPPVERTAQPSPLHPTAAVRLGRHRPGPRSPAAARPARCRVVDLLDPITRMTARGAAPERMGVDWEAVF